jgi:hypothetical protein
MYRFKEINRGYNVANEIANLERSYANYTTNYKTEFNIDIEAKLTTITNLKGIIKENTWFALATTFAQGLPLSDLIESKLIGSRLSSLS